jgi:hypothetical protein
MLYDDDDDDDGDEIEQLPAIWDSPQIVFLQK